MSFRDLQNPGIGGLEELTDNEQTFVQNLSSLSYVQGDILYYSGSSLTRLPIGSPSNVLKVNAGGTAPEWGTGGGGSLDGSGTTNELVYWVDSDTLGALAVATYPSLAELSYVKGVSSSIQTQIGTKASSTSPTFATSITGSYLTASEILITDGSKNIVSAAVSTYPSLTELTYLKGVTSAIQTQFNSKQGTISFGTGVQTALGVNIGSAGAPLLFNGALGTPSSGTVTNLTGTASININGTVGATTPTTATFTTATINTGVTLSENASIDLDPALSADGKYTGICIAGTAGAALAFGDLVYLAVADSRWELADADAATTSDRMLGMCVLAAASDGSATKILLHGNIRADSVFPTLTIGAPVYVGETAGDIQVAIPTGADNVIRRVGYALTADELYFCPSMDSQIIVA